MCFSPNSNLVQRTIELNYVKKKRAYSIKWFFVNVFFFILFTYDLTCTGPCPASLARYLELVLAGVACASALRHGACLLSRRSPPPAQLSKQQLRLLGLTEADLDSSLVLSEKSVCSAEEHSSESAASDAELSLSLSPRCWREQRASPPSPAAAPAAPSTPPPSDILSRDRFIDDHLSLTNYLKNYETQQAMELAPRLSPSTCARGSAPPTYQLSALDSESSKEEGSPQGSPEIYWQLDIDPQKLTQWNLNLRLWIHMTILEPLVRELDAAEAALARLGGRAAPLARLRQLAAAHGAALPGLRALLPFLEPFADQRYVVRRIRTLARGPCLSNYRWAAGGPDWDQSQPTDADIILHLFATYLDGQMTQSGNARPFSSQCLSAGPRPGALALHRVGARPPHFALALRGELLGVPRGRANLLHALLLLLAAAARRRPPALARTPLGPAGLNMLWIIGR